MKIWKKTAAVILAVYMISGVLGCTEGEEQEQDSETAEYYMYYVSPKETSLEKVEYVPKERTSEAMVQEIAGRLSENLEEEGYLSLLPENVGIQNLTYEGQTVSISFNSEYKKMKNTRELLARAGIVKAFTQIPEVNYVEFFCDGESMTDASGVVLGKMDKNTFVENQGDNINSYIHTSLNLYFANESGDRLEKENISVYYSSNVPLEREVVERLLKGPKSAGLKPTLSSNTKILSVSIVEGICYVNLDKSFLTDSMDVQEELPIFSIVNSLTDACNVRGVQISVDGKTAVNFRESMKLDQIYHADYRLTEENQDEKEEKE